MKKTFKKIAASLVAITSLAVSVTGFSASATDGKGNIKTSSGTTIGTAYLSVSSSSVWVKTAINNSNTICRTLTASVTSTTGGTISGDTLKSAYNDKSVSLSCSATGVTKATSYHYINVDDITTGSAELYVVR